MILYSYAIFSNNSIFYSLLFIVKSALFVLIDDIILDCFVVCNFFAGLANGSILVLKVSSNENYLFLIYLKTR